MTITVKFFASFREVTGVKEIELPTAKNVKVLINTLVEKFGPKLTEKLYEPDTSRLRDWVNVLVNGRNVKVLEGLDTALNDNDVVAIFPPVGGG
jgi:molybdopterin synthase sulfur carrier subunit